MIKIVHCKLTIRLELNGIATILIGLVTLSDMAGKGGGQMNPHPEFRHRKRFKYKSIVTLEDRQQGHFIYGQMKNMSADGICLEADYAIRPGTLVDITIDKPPYKSRHKKYRALVKWCDVIDDVDMMYIYEIGIKFL